jgi:NTE family protein
MALNVWLHPDVAAVKAEILGLAGNTQRLDRFFWLKAKQNPDSSLRLFRDKGGRRRRGDDEPFRIANIVLQGGGVLGLAHAGFVAGLELVRVRFAGVAGASAGAIMAMGMAAVRGDELLKPTHDELVKIVGAMPMAAFIDGPYRTRWLIKQLLLQRTSWRPSAWLAWLGALRQILHRRGLNPGDAFEDWLRGVLAEHGLHSVEDLSSRLDKIGKKLVNAKNRSRERSLALHWTIGDPTPGERTVGDDLLQIMAACTPVGVKFQFPRDVKYLSVEARYNSPAALVRASMSIPLFFEPALFDVNKQRWKAFVDGRLSKFVDTDKRRELAEVDRVAFLDGGIFSNLPVDAFSTAMPDVPTIAVPLMAATLAKPYQRRARLKSLVEDIGSVAFMVRNQRDRDAFDQLQRASERFALRKGAAKPPSHPFRLAPINVGNANWLNFVMDETDMTDLFLTGLRRARDFIRDDL